MATKSTLGKMSIASEGLKVKGNHNFKWYLHKDAIGNQILCTCILRQNLDRTIGSSEE